ncbi:MAG: hypothetical protein JWN24_396 [Phycisphaerales bacterium]|nr:hypothetical protein [Phycisphaerales bacterium]
MKIKLDENLPTSLVAILQSLGHDVDTVPSEGFAGRADDAIWEAEQIAGRFLITQELDFSDIRRFAPGTHHGLLIVRLHSPGRIALARRVESLFRTEQVERWTRCFVVATDRKIRVRAPGP